MVAVLLFFLLKPYLGTEILSWVCILAASPFAAFGFFKYNGMVAEKAIYAWYKSTFLIPKKLVFKNTNDKQKTLLNELLKEENNSLWLAVLYGIGTTDGQIVSIALSQVGNVGGQPYWSWYGFSSRVEWCACFVSWCANECGYIDAGIIPKFAGCVQGSQWFMDRGQWADRSHEPSAGTIIFFDWENDGVTDHVGIVERYENGIVYTVEGNSLNDMCRQKEYSVGSNAIYGYGIPAY